MIGCYSRFARFRASALARAAANVSPLSRWRSAAVPMRADRLMKRLVELGWRRRLLLVEAMAAVVGASLAVRFLPFRHAVRGGARTLAGKQGDDWIDICHDARWSVVAVARHVPWRALCFQQGLALQWMLRRRGVDARLHYGIGYADGDASLADRDLAAHVWVVIDDEIVLGGHGAASFRSVAVYP